MSRSVVGFMESIDYEKFLSLVEDYNPLNVEKIKKAYEMADYYHKGQYRQSGEPYIIHPLNVAYSLAEMYADSDTVCAGLLHDTLEDTKMTKAEIEEEFNKDVASLVDGVTNISRMNFSSQEEENLANTRKIINGLTEDVRIIIIKLADRLHNMRTLQYKSEFKQKENSLETLEIFTPLANHIGAYRIQNELEDLSLSYLKPDAYKRLEHYKEYTKAQNEKYIEKTLLSIKNILDDKNIPNEIKIRTKNIYSIYKRIHKEGYKLKSIHEQFQNIHDLFALKIMVDTIPNCYQTLGIVHSKYHPMNDKFKDFIYNPKTNLYRSLHTTVFGENERLVQAQIRTFEMDRIASFGLPAYWAIDKGEARVTMQQELKSKKALYNSLQEIDNVFLDNQSFVERVKTEIFSNRIYVYTPTGEIIELPVGSTPIDFAYSISDEVGNNYLTALVNDESQNIDYQLKNNDRVKIITSKNSLGPQNDWVSKAKTTNAKTKILEFRKKHM